MPTFMFSLMRLNPPQHIISNTHPDPNEHCIGHQTTHNDHVNHPRQYTRTHPLRHTTATSTPTTTSCKVESIQGGPGVGL